MVCPNCKSYNVKVAVSFPAGDDLVCRRRKCTDCGYCFRTIEMLVDGNEELSHKFAQCERVHREPYNKKHS